MATKPSANTSNCSHTNIYNVINFILPLIIKHIYAAHTFWKKAYVFLFFKFCTFLNKA